jgi:hypothetical protein
MGAFRFERPGTARFHYAARRGMAPQLTSGARVRDHLAPPCGIPVARRESA